MSRFESIAMSSAFRTKLFPFSLAAASAAAASAYGFSSSSTELLGTAQVCMSA